MPSDSDLLTEQERILASINRTLETQLEFLENISNRMSQQSNISREASSALDEVAESAKGAAGGMSDLGGATQEAASYWDSFTSQIKSFIGEEPWNSIAGPFSNALSLLGENFKSLSDVIMNPVKAAFGFLTQVYNTVIELAIQYAKELIQLEEAFEKVRDKFGSFNEDTSRRIKTAYQQFSGSLNEAAGNTKAFASKFNIGIQGAIERLEKIAEIAEDMGPTFQILGQQFNDASAQLYVMKEGLNFTSDSLQQVARLATLNGKSLKQFSQEIMSSVDKIGRQFNISTKVLGSDVGKALTNFKLLGKMTGDYVKEITKAAVFTRKLGFEISELTGLVDKFDDFEQGAEAAAQLAQGFGLVLDPLKMVNMQDPAARLQEVQRAFIATGRSFADMDRQQRTLLASTTGMDEKILATALSAKGLSMSYDEISAGADEAAKKQKTAEQTITDLADNIENVIQPLLDFQGFISAFFAGFRKGFLQSTEFIDILGVVATSLRQVQDIGIRVGKIFASMFFAGGNAGERLKTMMVSISEMFVSIAGHIEDFMKVLKSGGANLPDLIAQLFDGIYVSIQNAFFKASGEIDVTSMITRLGTTLLQVLTGAVKFFTLRLKGWTEDLKKSFTDTSKSDSVGGGIKGAFDQLIDSIPELTKVIEPFGEELIKALGRAIENFPIISLFVVGGPLTTALGGVTANFFRMLSDMFSTAGAAAGEAAATGAGAGGGATGGAGGVFSAISGYVTGVTTEGQGLLERVFSVIETPAKIALLAKAIATSLSTLATAIRDVILVFTDPLPGRAESFMDIILVQAIRFSAVPTSGIVNLGLAIGGIAASLGVTIAAIATAAANLTTTQGVGLLLGAATVGFGLSLAPKAGLGFFGSIIGGLGRALDDIATHVASEGFLASVTKLESVQPKLSALAGIANILADMMVAIGRIVEATPTSGWITKSPDFSKVESSVSAVINYLVGEGGKTTGLINKLNMLPDAVDLADEEKSLNSAKGLMVPIEGIMKSLSSISDTGVDIYAVDNVFTILQRYVDGIESRSIALSNVKFDQFRARLDAMVKHTSSVRDILENLGDISLDATIDKMEKDMNVAKTTLTVNGGAVKINVNMNVTMSAEKMAASLVMDGYLKPNEDFGNYLQTNDGVGEYYENPGKNYMYGTTNNAKFVPGTGIKSR